MLDALGLLHRAEDLSTANLRPRLEARHEVKPRVAVEPGHLNAAGDELVAHITDALEGPLYAVVDRSDEPRAELHRERHSRAEDLLCGPDAGGVLVDLHDRAVAGELDDLADEACLTDEHELHHHGVGDPSNVDDRAVHPRDVPNNALAHPPSPLSPPSAVPAPAAPPSPSVKRTS